MTRKMVLLSLIVISSIAELDAQEQLRIPVGITSSFRTGNSAELSKYFNATVQVMVLGKEDFYKKNVAETILKDFFSQHKAKDFVIRHQGGTADAHYAIGNMTTEKGDFRIYFLLKKVDQELLIHQLRIEPDDGK